MISDSTLTPHWFAELQKHLVAGKQVLLHGNVADLFWHAGTGDYIRLREVLQKHFLEDHFSVVGAYDIVDDLRYEDPKNEMPAIIREARIPEVVAAVKGRFDEDRPRQHLDNIRHILGQGTVSVAFIVEYADKLFGDPVHQQSNDRALVVLLQKAVQESAFVNGRRNALVVLASQTSNLPPWFHHDNPYLAVVHIPSPNAEERRQFLLQRSQGFFNGSELEGESLNACAKAFADLSDGLTLLDLEAIRRTSLATNTSIRNTKAVIDLYKHGHPVENAWEKLGIDDVRNAGDAIGARVFGQPRAVAALADMLMAARVGISMTNSTGINAKPRGVFFFVGPTGVGKTELAKSLAQLVFKDESALRRFDMSEYKERHHADKLIGAPPGFVGYSEGGQLTNYVQQHPFSVLLFDEIDKAHEDIMNSFLQVLEDGRLTDGQGRTTYFSESVIIFTSNLGAREFFDTRFSEVTDEVPLYDDMRDHFQKAVDDKLRPEVRNRLGDNIVVFDMARPRYVRDITRLHLKALERSALEKRHLHLECDETIVGMMQTLMTKPDNLRLGYRRIKSLLEICVERPLNRFVLATAPIPGTLLRLRAGNAGDSIAIDRVSAKV